MLLASKTIKNGSGVFSADQLDERNYLKLSHSISVWFSTYLPIDVPLLFIKLLTEWSMFRFFQQNNFPKISDKSSSTFLCKLQSVALACSQGFIKSCLGNSTGWWAIIQLQCSQGNIWIAEGTSKKIKQSLYKQASATLCSVFTLRVALLVIDIARCPD